MNIARMAERAARHYPDKPAILFEDRCLSYRELDHAASRTAHALAKRGVETGDRVALYLPNIPAFGIAYQAVQKLGAIVVSASAMLTTDELAALLEDSGAGVVFTVEALWPRIAPLVGDLVRRDRIVICEGEVAGQPTLDELGAGEPDGLRARSVGTPIDLVDMRVVDEEDREGPPGAWGEVVFRGPNVMLGYWNRPEDTRHAMRGGWFHTGDVGYADDDGYLYLVDRVKDMINTGGPKIWPREVEEVLYRHPAIRECAVVGVSDRIKGEIPKAVVTTRPGAPPITSAELDAYCRTHLAAYKAPRVYEFVDELPKSPSGKILKRVFLRGADPPR